MATLARAESAQEFPTYGPLAAKLEYLVQLATLAPSIYNTRPWKFSIVENGIDLYADRSRQLAIADPEGRELAISLGAALYILRLGLRRHGMQATLDYLPSSKHPDLFARITCKGSCDADAKDFELYDQILLRHNASGKMEPVQLVARESIFLRDAACREHVNLAWIQETYLRTLVAEMVREGDRLHFHNASYRQEFARWMRWNGSDQTDEVSGQALGYGSIAAGVAPWLVRHFDVGRYMAVQDSALIDSAPMLGVFCTPLDDVPNWLNTGQALCRLELRAAAMGLVCSVFNQPLQVPGLRARFAREYRFCAFPQAFIRVGLGPESQTRMRSLHEVLTKQPYDCNCGCEETRNEDLDRRRL